ncbi:MAG: RICIN domain-containing protein, partial [Oscillospiraceae bacterium]|nr:RICIN domain-containing protein [Oscillospiraceae bacterium]
MNTSKRMTGRSLISLFLCMLMLLTVVITPASAAEDYRGWSQSDSRWGRLIMGDDKAATVSGYGCASVSMAKILVQSGAVASGYTPATFVKYMNQIGNYVMLPSNASGSIKSWANACKAGTGLSFVKVVDTSSAAPVVNYINCGYYCIVGGQTKYGGHFCAVDNAKTIANGYLTIMNSWSNTSNNINVKYSNVFKSLNKVVLFKKSGTTPTGTTITYDTIDTDTYYIQNASTGTYLTLDGGKDAKAQNVSVAAYTGAKAQQMVVTYSSKGCTIRPACCASRLLNPYADSVKSGVNVNIYDVSNDGTQVWGFQEVSGGYVIRNMSNQSCVLAVNGSNVEVQTYSQGNTKQIWTIKSINQGDTADDTSNLNLFAAITNDTYYVKNSSTGTYLTL